MNIALILSGGTGSRMGVSVPKQYIEVEGKTIIAYCLETFAACEKIDGIQVVADERWHDLILKCVQDREREPGAERRMSDKWKGFSKPGENRQLSILNGLTDIAQYAKDSDNIIIHDAARPLVTERMIEECIEALEGHEGVIPVLPVKDTVYYSAGGRIESLLDRDRVVAGQAPEGFRLGVYREANLRLLPDKIMEIHGSTEPAIMAELDVCCIPGDERNFKITTQEDLERFRRIVAEGV